MADQTTRDVATSAEEVPEHLRGFRRHIEVMSEVAAGGESGSDDQGSVEVGDTPLPTEGTKAVPTARMGEINVETTDRRDLKQAVEETRREELDTERPQAVGATVEMTSQQAAQHAESNLADSYTPKHGALQENLNTADLVQQGQPTAQDGQRLSDEQNRAVVFGQRERQATEGIGAGGPGSDRTLVEAQEADRTPEAQQDMGRQSNGVQADLSNKPVNSAQQDRELNAGAQYTHVVDRKVEVANDVSSANTASFSTVNRPVTDNKRPETFGNFTHLDPKHGLESQQVSQVQRSNTPGNASFPSSANAAERPEMRAQAVPGKTPLNSVNYVDGTTQGVTVGNNDARNPNAAHTSNTNDPHALTR